MNLKKGMMPGLSPLHDATPRSWYLVRCGKNLSREEAEKLMRSIKSKEHIQAVIRPMNRF
jgi:hypothetical protein